MGIRRRLFHVRVLRFVRPRIGKRRVGRAVRGEYQDWSYCTVTTAADSLSGREKGV